MFQPTLAQQENHTTLIKLYSSGDYRKCFKTASKFSLTDPGIPNVFKAVSLYQLRDDKAVLKKHKDPLASAIDCYKTASRQNIDMDTVPTSLAAGITSLQELWLRGVSKNLKSEKFDLFDKELSDFRQLFNNSGMLFLNRHIGRIFKIQIKSSLELKDELKRVNRVENAIKMIREDMQSLQKSKLNNQVLWYLKRIQDEIQEQIIELTKAKENQSSISLMKMRLSVFGIGKDEQRHFNLLRDLTGGSMKLNEINPDALAAMNLPDIKEFLDPSYCKEWNDPIYRLANTAEYIDYLTREEKKVILFINLCRMNPALFERTVLKYYLENNPDQVGGYSKSLTNELLRMPMAELYMPDEIASKAATWHATEYGESGKTGHGGNGGTTGRLRKMGYLGDMNGECCSYGPNEAHAIICQLLVDKDVSSLGHRKNLLSTEFKGFGVSIKSHARYRYNCVINHW